MIDAMGCQYAIVEKILNKGADYIVAVKDSQPTLSEGLREWFAPADAGESARPFWETISTDKDHGRLETRRCDEGFQLEYPILSLPD